MSEKSIEEHEEFEEEATERGALEFEMPMDCRSEHLHKIVATLLHTHSRGRLQQWIADGWVRVNGKDVKIRETVRAGDRNWVKP